MTRSEKILCVVYAAIAVIALFATWSNNLVFMSQPDSGGLVGFIRAAYANPAAASFANDLLLVAVAACIFMLVEARRLRIRFVWVYVVLSAIIAISVMFPLFLIARQLKMTETRV